MPLQEQTNQQAESNSKRDLPDRAAIAVLGLGALAAMEIGGLVAAAHEQPPDTPSACIERTCGQVALGRLLAPPVISPPSTTQSAYGEREVSRRPRLVETIHPSAAPKLTVKPKPSPTDINPPIVAKEGGDISFPQCSQITVIRNADHRKIKTKEWTYRAPHDVDFALVGLTDYKQKDAINPCLTQELQWGLKVGLRGVYANVRNPGRKSRANPDGYTTSPEPYGRSQAQYMVQRFMAAVTQAGGNSDPTKYEFWLDIEGGNNWEEGNPAANRAVAEGWAEYLTSRKIKVGLYSTRYMLASLIGAIDSKSAARLVGRESWLPAATCADVPLPTSTKVAMVQKQRVQNGITFDINQTCPGR